MNIMDFGNDDNFRTSWQSNVTVKAPWYEVDLPGEKAFNMIVITEDKAAPGAAGGNISGYRLEVHSNGAWKPLLTGDKPGRVKIHRFATVYGDKVRVLIDKFDAPPAIAEMGVYNERGSLATQ